ncbi:MAG: DUF177 domain-containing protein [Actinomycetota bacterium]|nr:DUF177 domain-containing protein [Actinomycetota bacterium]
MERDFDFGKFRVDIEEELPEVGEERHLRGNAGIQVEEGYELLLSEGESVRWDIELKRILGGVSVDGDVAGKVALICSRCLEEFPFEFSIRICEHVLLSPSDEKTEGFSTDDYLIADGILDFLPILRDSLCLSLPVKRICSEGCRGFCPVCGANLNEGECHCERKQVDVRLEPLKEIAKRLRQG